MTKKKPSPKPRDGELLPALDPVVERLEGAAFVASAIPVVGGIVNDVLGGWARERQMKNMREVVHELDRQIIAMQTELREEYIQSEEFADLVDQTLRRAALERHEEKRRLYALFLLGAIQNPGEPYDEQLRFLRTIELLQSDHVRIMKAMLAPSAVDFRQRSGAAIHTFRRRLPDISPERLEDLCEQLTSELRLARLDNQSLNTRMSDAENLSGFFTRYGKRLLVYIQAIEESKSHGPTR